MVRWLQSIWPLIVDPPKADPLTREERIHARIAELGAAGHRIMTAITTVRAEFQTRLGEAKQLVSAHPAYAAFAASSEPLHDEAERALMLEADDDQRST